MATIAACWSFSPTPLMPPSPASACKRRVGTARHFLGAPMSRRIFLSLLIALALALVSQGAGAQQPLAFIAVDWSYQAADGARRDPELIYKSLKAAFADTLKKKLNIPDPAAVADLEM